MPSVIRGRVEALVPAVEPKSARADVDGKFAPASSDVDTRISGNPLRVSSHAKATRCMDAVMAGDEASANVESTLMTDPSAEKFAPESVLRAIRIAFFAPRKSVQAMYTFGPPVFAAMVICSDGKPPDTATFVPSMFAVASYLAAKTSAFPLRESRQAINALPLPSVATTGCSAAPATELIRTSCASHVTPPSTDR